MSVTAAPGTTAPEVSVTVPLASPPRVCANAVSEKAIHRIIDIKVDFLVNSIDASTVWEQAGVSLELRASSVGLLLATRTYSKGVAMNSRLKILILNSETRAF